jgi:hypothetical protein
VRQPAIVEADCLSMISALWQGSDSRRLWEGVLWEIKAACNLLLDFRLVVVRREANEVAHNLAKLTLARKECVVKRFDCPDSVRSIVEREAPRGVTSESSRSSSACSVGVCNSVFD